mgnify:CR=1 FL=1
MTFDDWFVKSSIPDSMKHDLFDCWFQALVSRDPEVSELRQQLQEVCNSIGSSASVSYTHLTLPTIYSV